MHPILFRIPLPGWHFPLIGQMSSLPIYSYGVMLGLSIVVGWYLTLGLGARDGWPRDELANCYVITAIAAVIGSRLLYVATNLDEFHTFADVFAFRRGGLVAYGGFLGGFVGSYAYLKRKGLPLLPWADIAVPSLAIGLFITRIGCYLFGCDFGKPLTDSAPAVLKKLGTFPHWPDGTLAQGTGSPAWYEHYQRHLVSLDSNVSLPVHPTQIYESLTGLSLFALVMLTRKHQKFRGEVFLVFTFAYGYARFLLEILRDDAERGEYGPQIAEHLLVPGVLLIAAIAYIVRMARVFERMELRIVTQILVVIPPVLLFLKLRPESFAASQSVKLSTSQWVAAITATAAAVAFAMFWEVAKAHPVRAMAIDIPLELRTPADTSEGGDQDDQTIADEDQTEEPAGLERPAEAKKAKRKKAKNKLKEAKSAAADEAPKDPTEGEEPA
jgi:phosphatidylglycerol---prolipoprotein diacylglyceryl transferase